MEGDKCYTIRFTEEALELILSIINSDNVTDVRAEITERSEQRDLLTCYYKVKDSGEEVDINIDLQKD
jgi:hypothetical protein